MSSERERIMMILNDAVFGIQALYGAKVAVRSVRMDDEREVKSRISGETIKYLADSTRDQA
jgi:hypothetical protein